MYPNDKAVLSLIFLWLCTPFFLIAYNNVNSFFVMIRHLPYLLSSFIVQENPYCAGSSCLLSQTLRLQLENHGAAFLTLDQEKITAKCSIEQGEDSPALKELYYFQLVTVSQHVFAKRCQTGQPVEQSSTHSSIPASRQHH